MSDASAMSTGAIRTGIAHAPIAPPRDPSSAATTRRAERKILIAALAFIAASIALVAFGRYTGIGTVRITEGAPIAMRDLAFFLQDDGRLRVVDVQTGDRIAALEPKDDGFIHGAMRGLARERKVRGGAADAPWRLIEWDDGKLTLSDVATGLRIDLNAFGPTNRGAFARLLDAGRNQR